MSKEDVWFITGCSRGIGQAIALEALAFGRKVVATARNMDSLESIAKKNPRTCLALPLDVNDPAQVRAAVKTAHEKFGRIDVLVNNAGYGLQGMVEEVAMAQVRQQMQTNFFGLLDLTQCVLPAMREQGSGIIFNVSSIAGLRGTQSFGIYNASKFAVNGLSEALAQELAPFGIKVGIVEPGPYRTDWAGDSLKRAEAMAQLDPESPYQEGNAQFKAFLDERSGKQPGNPRQIARVLLDASEAESFPLHMVFGDVAIQLWQEHYEKLNDKSFMAFYPNHKFEL